MRGEQTIEPKLKVKLLFLLEFLILAELYFWVGRFGLSLAFVNASASAIWPPTGVALVALLFRGYRLWPAVFVGAFAVNIVTQGSAATSFAIGSGNTLEALLGVWFTRQFANGQKAFDRTGTIFRFVLLTAMLSTIISPTLGVLSLCWAGYASWQQYSQIWLTWWLGDMASNILIAPLLLVWLTNPLPRFKRSQIFEGMALLFLEVWLGRMVFFGKTSFGPSDYPIEYLAILPLLWAAFRFGERGALTFSFLMSSMALWGTRHGYGPFHRADPNESLLLLQTFMGTITLTAVVLASIISERLRVEERLEMQDAVSRVLAEAPSLREATPRIFQALCGKGEWQVGCIWSIDYGADALKCAETWRAKSVEIHQFETATRQMHFARGEGLPGRVWTEGKPVWVRDVLKDANFPRSAAAFEDGLHGAFCFPLKLGEEVMGVMECFSRRIREPDEDFLQLLTSLGSQLGQYIERKRAEEAQSMLATIVSSSEDAIVSKTLQGRITSWNKGAERIFGYTPGEAIGREITLIIPTDRMEEEHEILSRIRRGDPIQHYHTIRVRKDGKLIDVSLSISPIRDPVGKIIGAAKIARDITQEKKTERALATAQKELKQYAGDLEQRVQERTVKLRETIQSLDGFCYSIAHDLRAPLRALGGFSEELSENYSRFLDDTGKDYLMRIRAAAKRMDQLILDLLQFGRLDTAELPARTVELDELVGRVLLPMDDEIKSKKARVKLKKPLKPVHANSVMVEQVLVNLIGNALKFVPSTASPKVEVWTEAHDSMVRLYVKDNGIGIKPDYIGKLFQPFVRLVNGTQYPGTGIGLAIVRKGVERMGGKVGVESEFGKGSCFWIDLPAASAHAQAYGEEMAR